MYMVYRTCQIMFCFILVEMFLYEKNMKNIKKMKLFVCFKAKVLLEKPDSISGGNI